MKRIWQISLSLSILFLMGTVAEANGTLIANGGVRTFTVQQQTTSFSFIPVMTTSFQTFQVAGPYLSSGCGGASGGFVVGGGNGRFFGGFENGFRGQREVIRRNGKVIIRR